MYPLRFLTYPKLGTTTLKGGCTCKIRNRPNSQTCKSVSLSQGMKVFLEQRSPSLLLSEFGLKFTFLEKNTFFSGSTVFLLRRRPYLLTFLLSQTLQLCFKPKSLHLFQKLLDFSFPPKNASLSLSLSVYFCRAQVD